MISCGSRMFAIRSRFAAGVEDLAARRTTAGRRAMRRSAPGPARRSPSSPRPRARHEPRPPRPPAAPPRWRTPDRRWSVPHSSAARQQLGALAEGIGRAGSGADPALLRAFAHNEAAADGEPCLGRQQAACGVAGDEAQRVGMAGEGVRMSKTMRGRRSKRKARACRQAQALRPRGPRRRARRRRRDRPYRASGR